MNNLAHNLGLQHRRRARGCRFVSLLLLLLLGSFAGSATARADARSASVAPNAPVGSFAIADFDGDLHPDLASVETGRAGSSSTDYWIQLRLSASVPQSIRLVAPTGGLLIEALDVNGDHSVDLVLATAWLKYPVAILLNNGHGSFSRVAPSAFPEAFNRSNTNWLALHNDATGAIGIPPESFTGVWLEEETTRIIRVHATSTRAADREFTSDPFLVTSAGRAPPYSLHS